MEEKMFNLLKEPWICVMNKECDISELSVLELFEHAHEYVDLRGELATQDIAILRVLLAILHTVFSRYDLNGKESKLKDADDALDRWENIWKNGRFPMEPLRVYLESQIERFWLIHPDRPFYQCNYAKIGTEYTAAKLNGNLSESNDKIRLFSTVSGKSKNFMSFSEAARWLIYVNAYDDTSAKPSSEAKKLSEKLPSPGVGWLGKLGLLTIGGNNLFETLLLNMVMQNSNKSLYGSERPIWEREIVPSDERKEIPLPDNLAELYTLQSRRLLLKVSGEKVIGYYLLGGDFFEKNNAFIEPMTVWAKQKSKTEEVYSPRRHDPSKQFWREFGSVIPELDGKDKRPGIISWLGILEEEGIIDINYLLKVRIASVQYGKEESFIFNVFSDTISMHSTLILSLNQELQKVIMNQVEFCDKLAGYVRELARDFNLAAGGSGDTSEIKASSLKKKKKSTSEIVANLLKERFYQYIDEPFRKWLCEYNPKVDDAVLKAKEWNRQCIKIAENLGREMISEVTSQAIFGRNGVSAAGAINKFMLKLKKEAQ